MKWVRKWMIITICLWGTLLMSANTVEAGVNNNNVSKLLELAKKKYGILNEAERKLFQGVAKGESIDFSSAPENDNENNNPANAKDWGEERILKADRIAWLCTEPKASALVTHRGIEIWGARIDGKLDLEFTRISFPLRIIACAFQEEMRLLHANIHSLYLNGTHTGPIWAHGLKVEGDIRLCDKFKANGSVYLISARIGGNLECDSAELRATKTAREKSNLNSEQKKSDEKDMESKALDADGMEVKGSVFLRDGFKAAGEVSMVGATIGGNLECDRGHFINQDGKAITADGLTVKGNVFFRDGFTAEGEVRLMGAIIGGELDCSKGTFLNNRADAFKANKINVRLDVLMQKGFRAEGEVRFNGATIGGNLNCEGGQFINPNAKSFMCDGLQIQGAVFLRNKFRSEGEVRFNGATIGLSLECDGSSFINPNGKALNCDGLKVDGYIFLRNGFYAEGEVDLRLLPTVALRKSTSPSA
jgi:sRNA-binding regulator protein Hfq